ncbi:MAG: CHAT domain-containing protein [Terracoccus sp.]
MSDVFRFELFDAQGSNPRLRWFPPDGVMQERRLDRSAVDDLVTRVSDGYSRHAPDLPGLGADLYRWLDGPTERWLQSARDMAQPILLYAAAKQKLRALPWELLLDESFLAVDPSRPVAPVREVSSRTGATPSAANRPLRVLFMAASPIGVEPVLDFDKEEAVILAAATGRVEVIVEESGSLAGLAAMLNWFGPDYFDVLHLSGHGFIGPDGPRFVMEGPDGGRSDQSAAEIRSAVQGKWPGLLFVSGCYTGGAPQEGAVASMAEALVDAGAAAVLGWALPVGDVAASSLAAKLYGSLAVGETIAGSVSASRRALFEDHSTDWHTLRLYADRTPLGSLVTAPATKGRVRLRTLASSTLFLDAEGRVKVADRASFVGRRREMQALLRALRPDDATQGPQVALLHGMGGLGKSTLAARLLERLGSTHEQRAVWVGKVDAQEIISLTNRLRLAADVDQQVNELMNREGQSLAKRLGWVLDGPLADTPCLFVFDDFEDGNLEKDGHGGYIPTAQALEVLDAFATAITRAGSSSRIIVTSRYNFSLPAGIGVLHQPVSQLQGADLEKKLRSLENLGPLGSAPIEVRDRAVAVSAGVPRLLERIDRLLGTDQPDLDALLASIEQTEVQFREELLLAELLESQTSSVRQVITLASVYEIAVPREAILALSPDRDVTQEVEAAIAVGLIQAGHHPATNEIRYLVSPLLLPLLDEMPEHLDAGGLAQAQGRGAKALYQLWVDPDGQ